MDLQFLRPLYEGFGGYVSVYLDTSLDAEDPAHAVGPALVLRPGPAGRSGGRRRHAGRPGRRDDRRGAPGRAAFGRGGRVVLTEPLPHPPRREIARLAPLPHVMPLLAQRGPRVPHRR